MRGVERCFFETRFFIAVVAEGIVEHGAEFPSLFRLVPTGPCIARDVTTSALSADNGYGLAIWGHPATLPIDHEGARGAKSKLVRSG